MRRLLSVLLAVSLTLQGCSFLFVDGPPAEPEPGVYESCTEGRAAPIADLVFTLLYVSAAVGVAGEEGGESASVGMAVFAAPFAISAYVGFVRTASCRKYHRELNATMPDPGVVADPAPGTEGHACYHGGGCNRGLECVRGRCLNLMK